HSIITTLNRNVQQETTRFILGSKYHTSIICIAKGQVIAVASSSGTDYPFTFKTNVGSTLKPFIYTFLRENGVSSNDIFSTTNIHNLNWDIREVQKSDRKFLTLKEALLLSNNNAFVNASYHIGIEKILSFLAKTTNKPVNKFVPASVLGATIDGITLYELINTYYRFFLDKPENPFKKECISILKKNAIEKFGGDILNVFLKTGTTNQNKERYGVVGTAKMLFGFLRQGNEIDDYTKEGNFLTSIMSFLRNVRSKIYKWE
ncbi:MAG: penicillin-binding transpeptidase domain-containing protein, partial [Thermodesulfovibrionales bacterium]|nr:penicillin-binding transpeptidase domain-containing protein [Thermodesulfovibrionales bacterium]